MQSKILIVFVWILCTSVTTRAQSLFHLQYRNPDPAESTIYNIFLVRNDNGSGFYRVNYRDRQTGQENVVGFTVEQKVFTDENGVINENKLYLRGLNPQLISRDTNYNYQPILIWFNKDTATGLFEPSGLSFPGQKGEFNFAAPPQLLHEADLTQELVSPFFLPVEDFYKSLFDPPILMGTNDPRPPKKPDLHLVIVANTEAEDIGNTCALDKDRTLKIFKDLAEYLELGFKPKLIFGNNYNKKNVQSALKALRPGKKDIVVFYYSGHGFSDPKNDRPFPNMALSNKSYDNAVASAMNIEDVFETIRKKGARFNLVLSDCCNNSPDDRTEISCDLPRTRSSGLGWRFENCRSLFLDSSPKSILMTAAQKGEVSAGNVTYGGFFTNQFRTNLTMYFGFLQRDPTWDAVLEAARQTTTTQSENSRCSNTGEKLKTYKQHPLYKMIE